MKILLAILINIVLLSAAQAAGRNWTLTQVNGGDYSIADNSGKPSLLLFWATWCNPCKAELSAMKATFDSLAAHGLNVVLVSEDNQKSKSRVKPYLESKGYTWTALHDPDGAVLKSYGGTSIPFSVLLDSSGSPILDHKGEMKDASELLTKANELLESAGE